MKKTISITTHYYNSYNYGGLLQSYALYSYLEKKKYWVIEVPMSTCQTKEHLTIFKAKNIARNCVKRILGYKSNREIKKMFDIRRQRDNEFRKNMHHFEFFDESLYSLYISDINIVGSDQVWNPNWYNDAFFLNYVPDNIPKIAYSASIGLNKINQEQLEYMVEKINRLDYISVREDSAKKLLQPYVEKKIKVTIDPTLLLTQCEWNALAITPKYYEHYIFVYLLGNDSKSRKQIKQLARRLNLKIAFIPHINFSYLKNDINFGDIEIYDAGPAEFLGWIKNAEMVITDSFHGCVFSIIYEKQFLAVKRTPDSDPNNMNSRLYSLFENLGIEKDSRFLENLDILEKETLTTPIDYYLVKKNLTVLRQDSYDWLRYALEESEKNCL